jgi:hypothetical protein
MEQTYTIAEFTTGEWSERPEYACEDIAFSHVKTLHEAADNFADQGRCGETDYWYFLEIRNNAAFEFYIYSAEGIHKNKSIPHSVEPFIWIYGTLGDGVRECSGGQNFNGNLLEMSAALTWLHMHCCDRWPQFKEWYE